LVEDCGSASDVSKSLMIPEIEGCCTNADTEQLARIKAAYVTIRLLQRYDWVVNAERPYNAPMRFHHTIENTSGSGVKVWLHESTPGVVPKDF
jgi:hypothetical protein